MPTRSVAPHILKRAFDLLAPPEASPKEFLRWQNLARQIGLGEHWIRKRYYGLVHSELDARSIELICKALERRARDGKDMRVAELVQQLSGYDAGQLLRPEAVQQQAPGVEATRRRVVNLAFIRGGSASYVMRTEAGIRAGLINELRASHLVDDETVDIGSAGSPAAHARAINELLKRFNADPSYVDRTYLVSLGTPATMALASVMKRDARFRSRLGRDFRVIFAALSNAQRTGILEFDRNHVGGMINGIGMGERVRFAQEIFPGRPIAYVYDPDLVADCMVLKELQSVEGHSVLPVKIHPKQPLRVPAEARGHLVMGWYHVNVHIHQFVLENPTVPFVGINTTALGRGAVISTGNDEFLSGVECAGRLIGPDCRNEINLGDTEILIPQPIFGLNQKACNLHGLVPKVSARGRCRVILG